MAARRSHYKSRTGCGNCKRRKIKVRHISLLIEIRNLILTEKCDETKPECNQCLRHAIACDYAGAEVGSQTVAIASTAQRTSVSAPSTGRSGNPATKTPYARVLNVVKQGSRQPARESSARFLASSSPTRYSPAPHG